MYRHPLGLDKARLLNRLRNSSAGELNEESLRHLGAVFPELYFVGKTHKYHDLVMKPFNIRMLAHGDLSDQYLQSASEYLDVCDYSAGEENAYDDCATTAIIELSSDGRKAGEFLLSHYYFHAMFKWFWGIFDVYDPIHPASAFLKAFHIAYYDNKPLDDVEGLFARAYNATDNVRSHQRLLNQLGVMYIFRNEFERASQSIEASQRILDTFADSMEATCRMAELLNSRALLLYKTENYQSAAREITKAQKLLNGLSHSEQRVRRVRGILTHNAARLASFMT